MGLGMRMDLLQGKRKQPFPRFWQDSSGNIAILFGLAIIPVLIAIGTAIDYTRVTNVRTKLDGAADMATLASVSKSAAPFTTTPTPAGVKNHFNAIASAIPSFAPSDVQVNVVPGITAVSVTLNYTGKVQTVFGGIIGVNSVTIGGTATAKASAPPYVNFYLLLDNSPSMGLGATPADISRLQSLTPDQCAFACHEHSFNSKGNITGDNLNDYYHIAKNNGVTTRIDVLRTATQQLTQTAATSAVMASQFGMAVYTFSDTFQTVAPLSTKMSTVSSNAAAIDLAYAYYDQRDAQTSFDTALRSVNAIMPDPGDGSSPTSPREFLFLVTDGIEDAPAGGNSGSGDPPDKPTSYLPPNSQPNLSNSLTGNVNSGRLIDLIKASAGSMCDTIKKRGTAPNQIKIAVLYTPYQPVTNNGFYNTWVAPYNGSPVNPNDPTDPGSNQIGQALKNCASPGFYYQVTPTTGISEAMQRLFMGAVNSVQLTN
ncbi:Flp pilus assembly protein TadG [Rhizobiales bacterium GAS113]|nr:Flp pilus assembly protein TadG [Rhizobiales bacterium GAS113]